MIPAELDKVQSALTTAFAGIERVSVSATGTIGEVDAHYIAGLLRDVGVDATAPRLGGLRIRCGSSWACVLVLEGVVTLEWET